MAEGIIKKKRICAGHRASATHMIHQVEERLAAIEAEPTVGLDLSKLVQLKLSLEEKLDTLKRLDEEILDMVENDDNVTEEIEQADDFKERIYLATVNINNFCTSCHEVSSTRSSSDRSSPRAMSPTRSPYSAQVKLPKLTLRNFNGDITDWTTFWDSFESAIDKNPQLSDIDKFNYLKSLLERSAAEAISGLTLTSANYKEAIHIHKRRFGNKQQSIISHSQNRA